VLNVLEPSNPTRYPMIEGRHVGLRALSSINSLMGILRSAFPFSVFCESLQNTFECCIHTFACFFACSILLCCHIHL
jgi:hypothetical protein